MNINPSDTVDIAEAVKRHNDSMRDILDKYGVPDPKIVGKRPQGGIQLDYVSHAEITRILIDVDPNWEWEPVAWGADGMPATTVVNGKAHMFGRLTINGVTRVEVGSVAHNKQDLFKELVSDFLTRGAMRFGIALSLWSKQDWQENDSPAATPKAKPAQRTAPAMESPDTKLTVTQQKQITDACTKEGFNVKQLTDLAGVKLEAATNADLVKFRQALRDLMSERDA